MNRSAYIFVGLTHTELWPVRLMLVGARTQVESIVVARTLATNARLGALARSVLERFTTTHKITGWKRVYVTDLFPPPRVDIPAQSSLRTLHIGIEECEDVYVITPYMSRREGWQP